jgi:WD40 repeat protein
LDDRTSSREKVALELNKEDVNWAAPAARRETESKDERLPFPKYHLEEEYDDSRQAARDKRSVEFNRALLVNGFRRLEALERKREYETMPAAMQKMAKEGYHHHASSNNTAIDPLKPTILLSTLCASTPGPILRPAPPPGTRSAFTDAATIWEEAGIGLCCAKVCPPDGRRVAVGCDDSAIRIWNLKDDKGSEPTEVLLGHKNGFPVFDVAWNRDGRSLLSAGGDGSIRLWDTMAVGPFGDVANPTPSKSSGKKHSDASKKAKSMFADSSVSGSDMNVVGLRPENAPYSSGAALAVYRGHAPSSPVWAVSFAPSGYYFASAGGDATARLWTTDRPTPVRLFTGHSASNLNIQTGQTVRLLNGCSAGINHVKISPGGRYAAGSDYSGVVHLWNLGNGKKITEFRTASAVQDNNQVGMGMVHSLAFSTCGNALAAGGDDGTVRIWDVRQDSLLDKPVVKAPAKSFPTRGTIVMDLSYTKRNLLLAMGKIATPVPSATHGTD